MDNLLRIDEDLFDIAVRLKEIDERYVLYRNLKLNRFEIHADGALQLAVPFDRLDARTLELARCTRLENANKLIAKIDAHNERLRRDKERKARCDALARVEDML